MTSTIEVHDLTKEFRVAGSRSVVRALAGISLSVEEGSTLAVVGESGSGKSTLGRCMLRLVEPDAGRIVFQQQDVTRVPQSQLRPLRARLQMVFQDPYGSVNPRMRIAEIVEEPLILHTKMGPAQRATAVAELLWQVGLDLEMGFRYPHELSGGQLQRVGIARAIATRPALIVLDEPTSSLDVSVRADILALLSRLQRELGLTYVLISHDLETVRTIADRLVVMYLGRIIESGSPQQIFGQPQHPYTQALLSASLPPRLEETRVRYALSGGPPDPTRVPAGCSFAPRCPLAVDRCRAGMPPMHDVGEGHAVACVRVEDGSNRLTAQRTPGTPVAI